jgi:predicted Zn-dependent protease
MGWIPVVLVTAIVLFFVLRFATDNARARQVAVLAVALGLSGYAVQGSPRQPGVSITANRKPAAPVPDSTIRRGMMGSFASEAEYLDLADALMRVGHTEAASEMMRGGLKKYPNSPDLWVGLGNVLVVHGNGIVSPAATFAFDKARGLAPAHPGPDFFTGLAFAQSGKLPEARDVWQSLLDRSPKDAPWTAELQQRVKAVDAALNAQTNGQLQGQ